MILAATVQPESISPADDLIERFRRGDMDALDVILPQYRVRLYRFLLRMAQEPAVAEDLFQQTWVRVIEKISSYNARYRFDSWLFSIARNLAIEHLRRKRGVSMDARDDWGDTPAERRDSADIRPLIQELPSGVKNLDAPVLAIGDIHSAHPVSRQVVWQREFTGARLPSALPDQVLPLWRVVHHSLVRISVAHKSR